MPKNQQHHFNCCLPHRFIGLYRLSLRFFDKILACSDISRWCGTVFPVLKDKLGCLSCFPRISFVVYSRSVKSETRRFVSVMTSYIHMYTQLLDVLETGSFQTVHMFIIFCSVTKCCLTRVISF